jgi:lysophospholipase L1-like esterase
MKKYSPVKMSGMGLGVLVMVLVLGGGSSAWAQETVDLGNIMPMGDSITEGGDWTLAPGSYRAPLYTLLTNAADVDYEFDYVGPCTGNPGSLPAGQREHLGISGATFGTFTDTLPDYPGNRLDKYLGEDEDYAVDPDIILLMIGTNNLTSGWSGDVMADKLDALVGEIFTHKPDVTLYLSSLTTRIQVVPGDDYNEVMATRFADYNARIPGIVTKYHALGEDIYFVDMTPVLDVETDLYDGGHPNAAGCAKMAAVWYDAIAANAPEPGTAMLLLIGSAGMWLKRKRG